MPLQFPFSYPLFTERTLKKNERDTNWQQNRNINSGVYYRNSIYYVWFEYLRSSERYKVICVKKGKVKSKAEKDAYTKFGNVFAYKDTKTAMEKFWKQSAQYFGYESLQVSEYTIDEQMDNNFVYLKIPFRQKAKSINMPFITERWPGGMLTNFITIRKAVKKMATIDRMKLDGSFEALTNRLLRY